MRNKTRDNQMKSPAPIRKNAVSTYSKNLSKEWVVTQEMGLLEFLLLHLKQSRNNTKTLLAKKKVMVDGVVVSQFDYMLKPKQRVSLNPIPIKQTSLKQELDILYEDDTLIVINKPAGLLTVASDNEKEKTAYRMLSDYVATKDKRNRVYITHRLDRDTSGVLMILKDAALRDTMQDNWNDAVVKRGYIAIVEGVMEKESGTIRSWLRETKTNIMYSSSRPNDGQEAITHYQLLKQSPYYAMLQVEIDSGRKNQIRVHMKDIGHLVIGDDKYGSVSNPLKRLGLHAHQLDFYHPLTKQLMKMNAPIPKEFSKLFRG
jgi:23S rRNA pseudouridine1911/1915/1917 synthase